MLSCSKMKWLIQNSQKLNLEKKSRFFSVSILNLSVKTEFVRERPTNINVGTLGHAHHGKTTLASLLSQFCSNRNKNIEFKNESDIDNTKPERESGHSQNASHIQLMTMKHHVTLSDLPGKQSYIKNLIAHLFQLDAALLVIKSSEGVTNETKLHYELAKMANDDCVILPLLNLEVEDQGDIAETEELIRADLEEFSNKKEMENLISSNFKTDPDLAEKILNLLDENVEVQRKVDVPLLWPLEQMGNIPKRGDFAAGRIKEGKLSLSSTPNIFYEGKTSKVSVRDIEIFKRFTKDEVLSGDRVGAFVKMKTQFEVKRGGVIFEPNPDLKIAKQWNVRIEGSKVLESVQKDLTLAKGLACVLFHGPLMLGACALTKSNDDENMYHLKAQNKILAKAGDNVILRFSSMAYCKASLINATE